MNLDKRQKVIVGLIILALAILIWQIYKIAGGEGTSTPSAPAATAPVSMTAKPAGNYPAAAQAVRTNAVETAAMLSNAANTAPQATTAGDAMAANQQKYLELVNEYQMSEIQRMIAEDQASIAQARYTAAEALSKITSLSGGNANLSDLTDNNDQTNPANYELIYTGEDNGQWTATVKKNGQFNDVTAGTVLPDGANVLSVDDNGVLLQVGSKKELVTFNGVTPFGDNSNPSAATPSQASPNLQSQLAKKTPVTATPAVAPVVQKPVVIAQSKPAVIPPPKIVAPKIAVVETAKPVPVATSVPDFIPMKQPNLAMANTASKQIVTAAANANQPSGYTIQIVADDQLSSINSFIAANQIQNDAHALKTFRNGKAWYIAVYGNYASETQASRALAAMPNNLRSQHPFVRKLSDVQSKTVE